MISPKLKPVLEFLPLAVFLVAFKLVGLPAATASLMIVTLLVVAFMFYSERKVAFTPLVTAVVVTVFGGLSLWFKNDMFIKMKPTVIYLIFALLLFGGCLRGKGLLSHIMGAAINLSERGWFLLSLRFACFFTFMALLNELIWRTMPTDWWVNFKVFGAMGLMVAFTMAHSGFIERFQKDKEE